MYFRSNKKSGFGMVEAIVAISIIGIFAVLAISVNTFFAEISMKNKNFITASFLAEEGFEAIKFLRDTSWNSNIQTLSNNTDYYLYFNSSWIATTTIQSENNFYRTFSVNEVYRDGSGSIVSSGGTLDMGTKFVEIEVAWPTKTGTSTKILKGYITNIFEN